MTKRKMPNHIVLPNGMWRFVKGKIKASSIKKPKRSKRVRRTGGKSMAKKSRKSSGLSGFGGSKLTNGFFKPKGMIQSAFNGIAAAHIAGYVPIANDFKYKEEVAGFLAGGIIGGATVFAVKNLGKVSGNGNTTGSW